MKCGALDALGDPCIRDTGHEGRHMKAAPGHHCHAVGCRTACKPEMLMCLAHWRMVPRALQKAVWATYRVGQCDDKNPSEGWHDAADRAILAVAVREGRALTPRLSQLQAELARPNVLVRADGTLDL